MALDSRKSTPLFLLALAGLVGYMAYSGAGISLVGVNGLQAGKARIAAVQDTIRKLTLQTDSAKSELAHGTVEDLKQRLTGYRASLGLLRRLVPDRNEVPNLLDDMTIRARIRGVTLSNVNPAGAVQPGPAPFDTYRYNISVLGHYDQIGQFLADVASLQRIIVPSDVSIIAAPAASSKALGDSTGAMLEAKFQIRTYVKSAGTEDASGT
ncbi:MAG: type 4a pilus biogenesis protein PilO [Gemmatimonadales bacterium]|nr:type 4a pilus biogenesis protein PilO [Gemmatimonadales bacterium]